jgi:hypothetical protein
LTQRGLIIAKPPKAEGEEEAEEEREPWEERPPVFAEKLRMLFEELYPEVTDVSVEPVWAAGELMLFGDFNSYVKQCDLTKQEGIVFRHLLRLILLCAEFAELTPADTTEDEWRGWLRDVELKLTAACRKVDPTSTDQMIQGAKAADVVEGEEAKPIDLPAPPPDVQVVYSSDQAQASDSSFGEGILGDGE